MSNTAPSSAAKRVVIFLNDLNHAGGIQRVATSLCLDLVPECETFLVTVQPIVDPVFYNPDVKYRSLEFDRKASSRLQVFAEFFEIGRRLRKFVVDNKIDVVVAIWHDMAIIAAYAIPGKVVKIGAEHISFWSPNPRWRAWRKKAYPHLDAVVSLTAADVPLYKTFADRVEVIPNAAQRAKEIPPMEQREKILLTVGHLIARKGVDRLLWALKEPLLRHPEWRLVAIGGGEKAHIDWGYCDYVNTLVSMLNLTGRVDFYPTTDAINDWYAKSSIFVMGSREEGLPMTLIEAKSHGLATISFDCPTGPREIIRHKIDGFLVKDDSNEFGSYAESLMSDIDLRKSMGQAALEDIEERFSIEAVARKWLNLFDAVQRTNGRSDIATKRSIPSLQSASN